MGESNISGVYVITNTVTRDQYIGRSGNIARRWADHKRQLQGYCHHSIHLQRAWSKYGEAAFRFDVLEPVPGDEQACIAAEQKWLDLLRPKYNISESASRGGPRPGAGRPVKGDSERVITSVALEQDLRDWAKAEAARIDVSMSDLLNEALRSRWRNSADGQCLRCAKLDQEAATLAARLEHIKRAASEILEVVSLRPGEGGVAVGGRHAAEVLGA